MQAADSVPMSWLYCQESNCSRHINTHLTATNQPSYPYITCCYLDTFDIDSWANKFFPEQDGFAFSTSDGINNFNVLIGFNGAGVCRWKQGKMEAIYYIILLGVLVAFSDSAGARGHIPWGGKHTQNWLSLISAHWPGCDMADPGDCDPR